VKPAVWRNEALNNFIPKFHFARHNMWEGVSLLASQFDGNFR